jgi:hypothetical protein
MKYNKKRNFLITRRFLFIIAAGKRAKAPPVALNAQLIKHCDETLVETLVGTDAL